MGDAHDPSRISLRAAPEFARENLNFLVQYSDYATRGDLDQVREIPAGTGALVRQELKKLAVYRDSHGSLHKRSAICPHLGCIVAWNNAEKTWDCPCHGSRFDPYGKVLNGPADRRFLNDAYGGRALQSRFCYPGISWQVSPWT